MGYETFAKPADLNPNLFAGANGKELSDADIDTYINTPLSAADRQLAHVFMRFMPPNQRGDFLYLTPDGRIISNNANLLMHAALKQTQVPSAAQSEYRHSTAVPIRKRADYSSSCSPPNPFAGTGPYVREVSRCGFSAGWAFLYIPCGLTQLYDGDNAYAYVEIADGNTDGVEGGVFGATSDLTNLNPYLRSSYYQQLNPSSFGFETLTNGSQRFSCNEQLAIFHGLTSLQTGQNYTFTEVGDASAYDPESVWVNQEQVNLVDAAWLFGQIPLSMSGPWQYDPVGYPTICNDCSNSIVTSIAQPDANGSWNQDGSYFGVDAGGSDGIRWQQVAFGNWDPSCLPGASLCIFDASADPTAYYGGPQYYPYYGIAFDTLGPTGYGPYESVAAIDAEPDGLQTGARQADIGLTEPLPPALCASDSMGYCAIATYSTTNKSNYCIYEVWNAKTQGYIDHDRYSTLTTYAVYAGTKFNETAQATLTYPTDSCSSGVTTWSPAEPKVTYNDANLP